MNIELWNNTTEMYLAFATLIAFVIALMSSINSFFSLLGLLLKWHNNDCGYDISWHKATYMLVALWTVFVVLNYFLGLVST